MVNRLLTLVLLLCNIGLINSQTEIVLSISNTYEGKVIEMNHVDLTSTDIQLTSSPHTLVHALCILAPILLIHLTLVFPIICIMLTTGMFVLVGMQMPNLLEFLSYAHKIFSVERKEG